MTPFSIPTAQDRLAAWLDRGRHGRSATGNRERCSLILGVYPAHAPEHWVRKLREFCPEVSTGRQVRWLHHEALSFCFLSYGPGGAAELHDDAFQATRHMSAIVQLSEPSEYEGGELVVEGKVMPRELGTLVLYTADTMHEVRTVTAGCRCSLSAFVDR